MNLSCLLGWHDWMVEYFDPATGVMVTMPSEYIPQLVRDCPSFKPRGQVCMGCSKRIPLTEVPFARRL